MATATAYIISAIEQMKRLQQKKATLTSVYTYWEKNDRCIKNIHIHSRHRVAVSIFIRQWGCFQLTMKTVKYPYTWDYTENIENAWSRQRWKLGTVRRSAECRKLGGRSFRENRERKKAMYFGSSVKHSHTHTHVKGNMYKVEITACIYTFTYIKPNL